jgi:hypothetical protein
VLKVFSTATHSIIQATTTGTLGYLTRQRNVEHRHCPKLWNYCNILRDDGLSYGDYVEQLTFLLFLKMADEQSRRRSTGCRRFRMGFGWDVLVKLDGDELETHYRHSLTELGKRPD